MPGGKLARRIKIDQAFSDLRKVFGDARLRARPVAAAHPGQPRGGAFGRAVFSDLMHLRHRHEHPVGPGILQV